MCVDDMFVISLGLSLSWSVMVYLDFGYN